ncbi:hypothetical protein EXS70_00585 [Candidatus Peribacteria bacterium]|nr:hypothetical protein [Candidatus Peribacteria bacterium]
MELFHGSSSASLPGVLDVKNPGLKAAGELLGQGAVPFCGELHRGIAEGGVNLKFISVVPKNGLDSAAVYAQQYAEEPWTPAIAVSETDWLKDGLQKIEGTTRCFSGMTRQRVLQLIDLHQKRTQQWQQLTPEEQDFVQHPFPIIYGIAEHKEAVAVDSDFRAEKGVRDVPPEATTMYVPSDKVSLMEATVAARGLQFAVRPLSVLAKNQQLADGIRSRLISILKKSIE